MRVIWSYWRTEKWFVALFVTASAVGVLLTAGN